MSRRSSIVSSNDNIVLVGAGGHARVLLSLLQRLGVVVAGYTASEANERLGCQYLGTDSILREADRATQYCVALAVGLPRPNPTRLELINGLLGIGLTAPPIIAATSTIDPGVTIAEAAVVLDGALVAVGSSLGRGAIINHNASVDHDCVIDDNVHIAPGATLCGNVRAGRNSMVGAGATVIPGIRIAENCLIGAGATVTVDTEPNSVYAGCPATRIR